MSNKQHKHILLSLLCLNSIITILVHKNFLAQFNSFEINFLGFFFNGNSTVKVFKGNTFLVTKISRLQTE
jgi:hypothetical protein